MEGRETRADRIKAMDRILPKLILGTCCALVALALAGCAAPAVSLLSPAVSSAPSVVDFLGDDVSESFWAAARSDVAEAARQAGQAYDLDLTRDETGDERVLLVFVDEAGASIRLRIERRTNVLTFVKFTGPSGMASLLSRQMVAELRTVDAFLIDWAEDPAFSKR